MLIVRKAGWPVKVRERSSFSGSMNMCEMSTVHDWLSFCAIVFEGGCVPAALGAAFTRIVKTAIFYVAWSEYVTVTVCVPAAVISLFISITKAAVVPEESTPSIGGEIESESVHFCPISGSEKTKLDG